MDNIDEYKILLENIFSVDINANDFFSYATAQAVQVDASDFYWILEHIKKHGQDGLNAAISYIQNQEPIKPHRTDKFMEAIVELVDRKQKVHSDADWDFYHYYDEGPYRIINKIYE